MTSSSTTTRPKVTIDGNEAAAYVAHQTNEVIAIYPITPSSTMGEWADQWSAEQKPNIWGTVPTVIEMQSEGGAAGALHGALQAGSLAHHVHGVAGPAADDPQHVQDRRRVDRHGIPRRGARAGHARAVDFRRSQRRDGGARHRLRACCASNSVQEAMDMALIAQAATLRSAHPVPALLRRLPHLARSRQGGAAHRRRPARHDRRRPGARASRARARPRPPVIRGTAQNPDVFFQAREACNPFYLAAPDDRAERDGQVRRRSWAGSITCSTTWARRMPSASSS